MMKIFFCLEEVLVHPVQHRQQMSFVEKEPAELDEAVKPSTKFTKQSETHQSCTSGPLSFELF